MKNVEELFEKKLKGKIAVYIDAANIELSVKDQGWHVDYKRLYKWLRKTNKLEYIGFYSVNFGTDSHNNFLTILKKCGYKLVTKPLKTIRKSTGHIRKANFDVEIAVDAMKNRNTYNTFILFSGDSDFAYLLKELKKEEKSLIVISTKYHIAKELIEKTDLYMDIKNIRTIIERKIPQKSPSFTTGG